MIKEKIDLPDAGLSPVGHVTIDLMDESGNVVERHEKDNYVHTRMLELMARGYMMASYFPSSRILPNLFSNIVLTDNAGSPNPETDRMVEGAIIGAGYLNQVFDSDYLGNYNSAESVIGRNYTRLVYDFGTSTANGTFQSIYTGKLDPELDKEGNRSLEITYPSILRSTGGYADGANGFYSPRYWHKVAGDYVLLHSSKLQRTRSLDLSHLNSMRDFFYSGQWEEHPLDIAPLAITYHPTKRLYYYVVTGVGSSWKVFSAPYDDPSSITEVYNQSKDEDSMGRLYGLFYDINTDTFIVVGNPTSSTSDDRVHIMRYSTDFKRLEIMDRIGGTILRYPRMSLDGNYIYLNGEEHSENLFAYSLKDRRFVGASHVDYSSHSRTNYENYFVEITPDLALRGRSETFDKSDSQSYVDLIANFGFFSRAVLDSPVTKTAQNTMKITYEFTMDDWII